jgi:nucleoid-associated protein YgaU
MLTPSPYAPNPDESVPDESAQAANDIPDTYTVEQGDNLIYISIRFYGTSDMVGQIMELNGLDDPDKIFSGRVLKLPK